MGYKKIMKRVATMLLVTVSITMALPTQMIALAMSDSGNAQGHKVEYAKPTATTVLGIFTETLAKHLETMEMAAQAGGLVLLKSEIKTTQKSVKDIRKAIDKELADNEKVLNQLKAGNAKKSHNNVKTAIDGQFNEFEALLNTLDEMSVVLKDLKKEDIQTFQAKLAEVRNLLNPEQPQQPLGALPHDNATATPPMPATGDGITPAYSGGTTAPTAGMLPVAPQEADLAGTLETTLTDEQKQTADTLQTSVDVYEYVKNTIDFEPYYGSRKGAAATLNQKAGNDIDQASLLIAMLRYKGIPSRYVTGTVDVSIDKAKSWTGADEPEAAVKTLCILGVPTTSVVSGGKIVAARIQHTWVEAYVPYENYRGVGSGIGRKSWIPLDPSFKQYSVEEGVDLKAIIGSSEQEIAEALSATSTKSYDGQGLTNFNTDGMNLFMNNAEDKIKQYLQDNNLENTDVKTIIGGKTIIPENLKLLPNSLPFKTVTVLSESNEVPDYMTETVGFSIKGNDPFNLNFTGTDDFNVKFRAAELYGKRITLSWIPATQEDTDIINHYGGLFKTPAYMIKLKPELKVNGTVVATGNPVGFGNRQQFTINMGHAGQTATPVANPVTAGGIYCVSLDFGKIDSVELDDIKTRVNELSATATEATVYTDEVLGEVLNSVGKAYFGQLDVMNSYTAQAANVTAVRQVSEAMTGYNPNVRYLYGTPVEVVGGSFYIDVDHDVFGVVSKEGKRTNEKAYMLQSGILGSSMEHGIMEQVFQLPSVSTIKILAEASERGIPIYTLSKANISKLSEIQASASVKADITNAVNSGKTVTIPKKEMYYGEWHGTGYLVLDPETGAAGYMISGGLAGGSTGANIGVTLAGILDICISLYFVFVTAIALAECTIPLLGILLAAGTILCFYSAIHSLELLALYWETGDYEAANTLVTELVLNIAFLGLFKLLEPFVPGIVELLKNLAGQMKGVADIAVKYGQEVANMAARYGDDCITAINKYGLEFVNMIKKYSNCIDDVLTAIKRGIKPEEIKQLDELGIQPNEFERFGITSEAAAEAVESVVETAANNAKAIGISSETELGRIGENAAEALSKGSKFTEPTLPVGGKPKGNYSVPDPNYPDPITRQNNAADILADNGYDITMLPENIAGNPYGIVEGKFPDFLIDGVPFDCFSPETTNVYNIWRTVQQKTVTQARRIVLNLDGFAGSMDDLAKQFYDWNQDLQTLDELFIIKEGKISRLIIN